MASLGLGLMTLGALGTTALIGFDLDGTVPTVIAVLAGLGTLALFHLGHLALARGRVDIAEDERVDTIADGVEREARNHLLENRAAELLRKIETLEQRRDDTLVEFIRAMPDDKPSRPKGNPRLVVVPKTD